MGVIEGPDCPLWVEVLGEGAPVTVFAHGVTGSTDETRPLARHVPGTRVLFDLRGHGSSARPPAAAGYDHPAMRRDLEAVADAYGATRALGISVGGGAILNLLADRPDRFERVVIFLPASIDGPNPGAADPYPPLAAMLEERPLDEIVAWALDESVQQPLFERRPYWRELVRERILRMNPDGVPAALRAYVSGAPPVADADALRRVRAPVLLLAHEGDPIHDVATARRLAGILPNARLEVWPETLAMYDDLDAFARLIGGFLGGEPDI